MAFTSKFYCADFHFGHDRAREMMPATRSFPSVEEMDRTMIERVNERVGVADLLFILGDFAVSADPEYVAYCFHALRGRKVLVTGNHDLDNRGTLKAALAGLPWDVPPSPVMETKDEGERLWLSHYAHRSWPAQHYGSWHFFGHSHGQLEPFGRSRDVGVDVPDMGFGPRTFRQITQGME